MPPNAQAVMSGFQAFAEGGMDTMKRLFSDDAIWHFAGRNKWSGNCTGPASIVALLDDMPSAVDRSGVQHPITWSNQLEEFLAPYVLGQ